MAAYTNRLHYRVTGAAAIAATLPVTSGDYCIEEVRLHLSAVGGAAEAFTVTIDSGVNAAYDVLLFSQDMNALTDIVWRPVHPPFIDDADEVDFAWANSGTKTYGLEVVYRLNA